jgi:hypothetical protein
MIVDELLQVAHSQHSCMLHIGRLLAARHVSVSEPACSFWGASPLECCLRFDRTSMTHSHVRGLATLQHAPQLFHGNFETAGSLAPSLSDRLLRNQATLHLSVSALVGRGCRVQIPRRCVPQRTCLSLSCSICPLARFQRRKSCRELGSLDAVPQFVVLPASARLWARLQAGRANTSDFHALLSLLRATTAAMSFKPAEAAMQALLQVSSCCFPRLQILGSSLLFVGSDALQTMCQMN